MPPTQSEIDDVTEQIERVEALSFARDGNALMPVLQGEPPADSLSFGDLSEGEKQGMLASWVNFEGFSAEEELDVISRVAAGQEPRDWFDGVEQIPDEFDRPYTPAEAAEIFEEWRTDYALRVAPDVTPPDAHGPEFDTWRERFESAATPYFEEMPSAEAGRAAYIPDTLSPADTRALTEELEQAKAATYIESAEQVAGWNYEQGEGGVRFDELPVADREVMLEDYVRWGDYDLTHEERGRVMFHAARDVPDRSYERQLDALAIRTPANDNQEIER